MGKSVMSTFRIFIKKFGDPQKSSLNLVKEFAQYFPLVLFLKKIHQNGHDICHQIWWFTKPITKFGEKNCTFLIYFCFLKKNHQNGHDICHQIWWKKSHFFNLFSFLKKITKMVTIIVTKFGDSQNPSPNLVKKIALF